MKAMKSCGPETVPYGAPLTTGSQSDFLYVNNHPLLTLGEEGSNPIQSFMVDAIVVQFQLQLDGVLHQMLFVQYCYVSAIDLLWSVARSWSVVKTLPQI